jgi:putative holliday junction resolvase
MLFSNPAEFVAALPKESRLLGLDAGETTLGLALSDVRRMIASPLLTIERKKFSKDMESLQKIIAEQHVSGLVIGLPMNMDGTPGPRAQSVRTLVSNLGKLLDLPMILWDERMSTQAVTRMMEKEADMSRKRRGELVDKLAATYILQGFLDRVNAC